MRAVRSGKAVPFTSPPSLFGKRADALTVLGEIVAELIERVELLEARERVGRAAFAGRKAGTVQARE
jgi:hypothetical protein